MATVTELGPWPPEPGAHFATPLADGRWGACRVLDVRGAEGVLVEGLDGLGTSRPTLADLKRARPLCPTHHAWQGKPNRNFVQLAPPPTFPFLGVVAPSPRQRATECWSWGHWESFPLQTLLEWRWKHDRKALLAEEAREASEQAKPSAKAEQQRRARLAEQTLEGLSKRRFFASWSRAPAYPPPALTRAARALMRQAIAQLLALGPGARPASKMKVLKDCVKAFNRLDDENDHFIETVEREDLCEQLEEIAHACGLGHRAREVHAGRTW